MSEAAEVVDLILGKRQSAGETAVGSLGDDPDAAARALKLSQMTGVPAVTIEPDLENFEAEQKAKVTAEILRNNTHIADYVNSHPLAAKVSNDDYGQLDLVSKKMKQFGGASVMDRAIKGFAEGFGDPTAIGGWFLDKADGAEFAKNYPLIAAIITANPVSVGIEGLGRVVTGGIHAIKEGSHEALTQLGASEETASRLSRDLAGIAEMATTQPHVPMMVRDVATKARPYIEAGIEPPLGIHPEIDKLKTEQHKLDLKNYDEIMSEAQGSLTKERSPELFAQFVRQQTDARIGLSAESVQKLYGEKEPMPGDGKLGFIPNVTEQFRVARETGGDIEVPMADWLAHVDPTLAKELKDDVRLRRGGTTTNEGKVLLEAQAMVEAYHGSPHTFEAFSLEKIGTGEGAQAYGHGLYFAEAQGVASSYKTAGASRFRITTKGGETGTPDVVASKIGTADIEIRYPLQWALQKMASDGLTLDQAIKDMGSNYSHFPSAKVNEAARILRQEAPKTVGEGNLYRVRINAEKEAFLDWDRPLKEQDPRVQGILRPILEERRAIQEKARADAKARGGYSTGRPFSERDLARINEPLTPIEEITGQLAYKQSGLPALDQTESFKKATDRLREAGIPGIKYLDQGSRNIEPPTRLLEKQMDVEIMLEEFKTKGVENLSQGEMLEVTRLEKQLDEINADIKRYNESQRTYNYVIFDPSIIQITHINDAAIEAIRTSADLKPLLAREGVNEVLNRYRGELEQHGPELKVFVPEGEWTPVEKKAVDAAVAELERILPGRDYRTVPGRSVVLEGKEVLGAYQPYADRIPTIAFLADPDKAVGTVRHEAIHYLRRQGFFTRKEWDDLKTAAHYNNWLEKHSIAERYPELAKRKDVATMIEEAVAEEFRDWRKHQERRTIAGKIFAKLNQLSEAVIEAIKKATGLGDKAYKIFERIESGEIGRREGTKPLDPRAYDPAAQALEEGQQQLFAKANAIGMTVPQFQKYQKLIEKMNQEDMAYIREKALKAERKRQTDEWKANENALRPEVVADVAARPDVAVEAFFREGNFNGQVGALPKLAAELLTEEQKAALPKSYVSARGLSPDDVAALFGYTDGKTMVDSLISFRQAMKESGVRADEYKRQLIREELATRMEQRYGDLKENILKEAEEHVLGLTQMELLHEETVALGTKAGFDAAQVTKEMVQSWIEQNFATQRALGVKPEKFLANAGRAGKLAEMELLKENFAEAYKFKQQQYYATLFAREAKKLDKEMEKFDKLAKRLSAREVKNVDQDYVDFAQGLLGLAGLPIRRAAGEITESVAKSGYTSLDNFVETKLADGLELAVSDGIRQGQVKNVKEMSVAEWREFNDAITSLNHVGRLEKQIQVGQQKLEFEEFKSGVLENIRSLPPTNHKSLIRGLFKIDAELVKMEEVIKDLDLRKASGPLWDGLVRPLAEAKIKEYNMLDKLKKELDEIKGFGKDWRKTMDDTIPQDFLIDPLTQSPFDLSREHMVNIMLNFGNRSNIDKFTRAYGGKEAKVLEAKLRQLFDQHATKEDWQYVQKVWDLFETWRQEADTMYRNLSGVPPKWIEVAPVDTVHGQFKGGYFPIIYDKLRSNQNVIEEKKANKGTFDNDYFRATTGAGYTKQRTGYVDYVQFENSIESVAGRMQQMIHDISHREAVVNAGKVIYDPGIRAAIRKHYGMEYEKQLHPWLKDIANHFNVDELATAETNSWLRRFRFNLVTHALGLNLRVILSPNPGLFNPINATGFWMNRKANVELAMQHSQEIPHVMRSLDRDFREKLEQTMRSGGWSEVQSTAFRWAFYPIVTLEKELRMVAFAKEFKAALREGMTEADAAARADSLIRERQGTAGAMDLPAIMRSNEAMKLATLFYGFFNTMYNWQRQIPGQLRRAEYGDALKTFYGAVLLPSAFASVLFTKSDKDDSWFKTMAKSLILQPLGTIPILREAGSYLAEGYPPRTPFESLITAANSVVSDVKKWKQGKPIEKPISHGANIIGLTAGLPLAQLGRSAQFGYDVAKGKQRPKNIVEWMRGIISGEARPKK